MKRRSEGEKKVKGEREEEMRKVRRKSTIAKDRNESNDRKG